MTERVLQHSSLYKYIDHALIDEDNCQGIDSILSKKAMKLSDGPSINIKKIYSSKILYIHPNAFDIWTDILLELTQKRPLTLKLIIICGSDYSIGDEHIEALSAFLPQTEFWIQNWCGNSERCSLLPIGVNGQPQELIPKSFPLGISFFLTYIGNQKREELYSFLSLHKELDSYRIPSTSFNNYCKYLSQCYFSLCGMGEGFDTFRFWESLMVGAIPIVKNHPFFENLLYYYPTLPIIRLNEWDDLLTLLPTLTQEKYDSLMSVANIECIKERYWIDRLELLSNA